MGAAVPGTSVGAGDFDGEGQRLLAMAIPALQGVRYLDERAVYRMRWGHSSMPLLYLLFGIHDVWAFESAGWGRGEGAEDHVQGASMWVMLEGEIPAGQLRSSTTDGAAMEVVPRR